MAKRVIAFLLWGFTAWYAMAYVVEITGGPALVAPLVGLAVGSIIAVDPRNVIWDRSKRVPRTASEGPAADTTSAAPVPTP